MARKRVSFTTKRGKRVSFTTGGKSNRSRGKGGTCPPIPPVLFRKGASLARPKGLRKGDIVQVKGKRGYYMVMKDELKPVKVLY